MEIIGDPDPALPTEKPEEKPVQDAALRIATLEANLANEKEKREYFQGVANRATERQPQSTSRLPSDDGREAATEDDDGEDLVEVIASGDKKKIKAALGKMGFVSRDEVNHELDNRWSQVETAASVQARHPDIVDPGSELHQETLKQIDQLKSQGINVPNLLGIAADLAYANLARAGRISRPSNKKEEGESEGGRLARIAAQQGQTTGSGRNPSESREKEGLDEAQRLICKKFGISEKDYAARANRGVRLAGVPQY